jgi:hypothetical protein
LRVTLPEIQRRNKWYLACLLSNFAISEATGPTAVLGKDSRSVGVRSGGFASMVWDAACRGNPFSVPRFILSFASQLSMNELENGLKAGT